MENQSNTREDQLYSITIIDSEDNICSSKKPTVGKITYCYHFYSRDLPLHSLVVRTTTEALKRLFSPEFWPAYITKFQRHVKKHC